MPDAYDRHPSPLATPAGLRRYVLLDAHHRVVPTKNMNQHEFRNRWPRDAALKIASRSQFYNINGTPVDEITIYLREIGPSGGRYGARSRCFWHA